MGETEPARHDGISPHLDYEVPLLLHRRPGQRRSAHHSFPPICANAQMAPSRPKFSLTASGFVAQRAEGAQPSPILITTRSP